MAEDYICHVVGKEFTPQTHAKECSQKQPEETGFGLAGGGYGTYSYCPECGAILSKTLERD